MLRDPLRHLRVPRRRGDRRLRRRDAQRGRRDQPERHPLPVPDRLPRRQRHLTPEGIDLGGGADEPGDAEGAERVPQGRGRQSDPRLTARVGLRGESARPLGAAAELDPILRRDTFLVLHERDPHGRDGPLCPELPETDREELRSRFRTPRRWFHRRRAQGERGGLGRRTRRASQERRQVGERHLARSAARVHEDTDACKPGHLPRTTQLHPFGYQRIPPGRREGIMGQLEPVREFVPTHIAARVGPAGGVATAADRLGRPARSHIEPHRVAPRPRDHDDPLDLALARRSASSLDQPDRVSADPKAEVEHPRRRRALGLDDLRGVRDGRAGRRTRERRSEQPARARRLDHLRPHDATRTRISRTRVIEPSTESRAPGSNTQGSSSAADARHHRPSYRASADPVHPNASALGTRRVTRGLPLDRGDRGDALQPRNAERLASRASASSAARSPRVTPPPARSSPSRPLRVHASL